MLSSLEIGGVLYIEELLESVLKKKQQQYISRRKESRIEQGEKLNCSVITTRL